MLDNYLKDESPRTLFAKRAYTSLIAAVITLCVSFVGYIAGSIKYSTVVANSSTAVGTPLEFKRSGVKAKLSGLYTDEKETVLIARISFNNPRDSVKMPSKGSDYAAFISSSSLNPKRTREITMLTGRLSSDGDMFVVLPRPNPNAVYSVFIMNTNYLANVVGQQADPRDKGPADIRKETESLTAALSTYSYESASNDSTKSAYTIENDNTDAIGFRMTLRPSLDGKLYKPAKINGVLLNNKNEFDFQNFFDKVFVESAQHDLEIKFQDYNVKVDQLNKQAKEMADRLTRNPNDNIARDTYTEIARKLSNINEMKQQTADLLDAYKKLKYDDNLFSNINTKATVLKG